MGIDTDGAMILGNRYDKLSDSLPYVDGLNNDDIVEVLDYFKLEHLSPYYDSAPEDWTIGFIIPDVKITNTSFRDWVTTLEINYDRLRAIFGDEVEIYLIGMQDVY